MDSTKVAASKETVEKSKDATKEEENDFEVSEVGKATENLAKLDINKDHEEKKNAENKSKLAKSSRVFKPKVKEKAKLENTGRTFKPPQKNLEEEKKEDQDYATGFNQGAPEYAIDGPDEQHVEDAFLQFQYENEQHELLNNAVGEFGEGLIRFEESSRNCECCQGLVERCDGDICQVLGECYCLSHKKHKSKS
ncbi:unnamed protein product [Moneuplotes crassus]|uniref:Uncharacterized protein n=1 Tax=Euplotes crassus TaxID=5936 RepID=A0AAD1XX45_EUPCR|nr:unnamed protein product [Moneuplotes crassus]